MSRPIVVARPGEVELAESELDPGSIVAGSPRTFEGEIAEAPLAGGLDRAPGRRGGLAGCVGHAVRPAAGSDAAEHR